jgi:hypothetical protein
VYGQTNSASGYAGYFSGGLGVNVVGDLSATGTKSFKIDHPLDPANKYLFHFAVESPEVLNQYSGVVVLDASGSAVVTLPAWFDAINAGPFRYQLTAIGVSMPDLYIAQKVVGRSFRIGGGVPGAEVSWLLFGLRDDPYLRANPVQTESLKTGAEVGTYLSPELYGQPAHKALGYVEEQR